MLRRDSHGEHAKRCQNRANGNGVRRSPKPSRLGLNSSGLDLGPRAIVADARTQVPVHKIRAVTYANNTLNGNPRGFLFFSVRHFFKHSQVIVLRCGKCRQTRVDVERRAVQLQRTCVLIDSGTKQRRGANATAELANC